MNTFDLQQLENMVTTRDKRLDNVIADDDDDVNDFEITANFPPKPSLRYQHLFDCRIQLLLKKSETIHAGESKDMETSCIILPHHGWILSTKANPALNLVFHEKYLRNELDPFRATVQVTNIQEKLVKLPRGLCIGYLLLY